MKPILPPPNVEAAIIRLGFFEEAILASVLISPTCFFRESPSLLFFSAASAGCRSSLQRSFPRMEKSRRFPFLTLPSGFPLFFPATPPYRTVYCASIPCDGVSKMTDFPDIGLCFFAPPLFLLTVLCFPRTQPRIVPNDPPLPLFLS